jgi:hypothetical protein
LILGRLTPASSGLLVVATLARRDNSASRLFRTIQRDLGS